MCDECPDNHVKAGRWVGLDADGCSTVTCDEHKPVLVRSVSPIFAKGDRARIRTNAPLPDGWLGKVGNVERVDSYGEWADVRHFLHSDGRPIAGLGANRIPVEYLERAL